MSAVVIGVDETYIVHLEECTIESAINMYNKISVTNIDVVFVRLSMESLGGGVYKHQAMIYDRSPGLSQNLNTNIKTRCYGDFMMFNTIFYSATKNRKNREVILELSEDIEQYKELPKHFFEELRV